MTFPRSALLKFPFALSNNLGLCSVRNDGGKILFSKKSFGIIRVCQVKRVESCITVILLDAPMQNTNGKIVLLAINNYIGNIRQDMSSMLDNTSRWVDWYVPSVDCVGSRRH